MRQILALVPRGDARGEVDQAAHGDHVRQADARDHGGLGLAAALHRQRELGHEVGVGHVLAVDHHLGILLVEGLGDLIQAVHLALTGKGVPVADGARQRGRRDGCRGRARCRRRG